MREVKAKYARLDFRGYYGNVCVVTLANKELKAYSNWDGENMWEDVTVLHDDKGFTISGIRHKEFVAPDGVKNEWVKVTASKPMPSDIDDEFEKTIIKEKLIGKGTKETKYYLRYYNTTRRQAEYVCSCKEYRILNYTEKA